MKEDVTGYRHATAHGNLVSYRQKRDGVNEYVEAWSRRAEYDNKTDKIELFGSARLKRGTDEVEGDYISYDITSDFFQVFGQPQPENDKIPITGYVLLFSPKQSSLMQIQKNKITGNMVPPARMMHE